MLLYRNLQNHFSLILILISFLLSSSCTFYQTIAVDPITAEALETMKHSKNTIIVHDDREEKEYILQDVIIENDSIKGTLSPAPQGKKHEHHKSSFRKKKVKVYPPLKVIHVYTSTSDLHTGPFEAPLSTIRFVETHHKDKRKSTTASIGLTAGIVVTIAGALTGLFFASLGAAGF